MSSLKLLKYIKADRNVKTLRLNVGVNGPPLYPGTSPNPTRLKEENKEEPFAKTEI